MRRTTAATWMILLAAFATGCSSTISPTFVRDAQLGASVKTALVNDPQVGTIPIEVRATGGVVRLSGRVNTDAQRQQAISLAKNVPGVTEVIPDLHIGAAEPAPPAAPPEQDALFIEEEREPRLLAVGLSFGRSAPRESGLGSRWRIGPLVRLGTGRGLGPALGFGWFRAPWRATVPGAPAMGEIRIRPVLGGIAYGAQGDRRTVSFSLVGGIAFNSLELPDVIAEPEIPLSISSSFAVRPGISMWFDVDRRFAVNIAASYLMTRPRVRVLAQGEVQTRSLRADALLINAGIVYKLF
jgi:hypothetical protein